MVALLLGALLSGMIMSAHLRAALTERWLAYNAARDAAYGALGAALPALDRLEHVRDSLVLPGDGARPALIDRAAWGLFDIRTCEGRRADQRVVRSALVGWRCDPRAPSLWVADAQEPIALAGEVRLEGTCYIPARGLRRAYIEGRPYNGALVLADQRVSERTLPALPARIADRLHLFAALGEAYHGAVPWSAIMQDSIAVAYDAPPLVVHLGGTRVLRNAQVNGHVLLVAADSVRVEASFRCTGIIIRAPHVAIASGFRGDLQCFTRYGAVVEPDVELHYPSVLVCTGGDATHAAAIGIGERATLEGAVIGTTAAGAAPVLVAFSAGSRFAGEVWNDGPVQLQGSITGTVMAQGVVLRTPSSVYRGHLMDVVLGPAARREQVGLGIWGGRTGSAVLRWLDLPV